MRIERAIRNVLFILENRQEINENQQGQNRFHYLCGEMITMGTDIVNTVLPRITSTTAGEHTGELCQATSE